MLKNTFVVSTHDTTWLFWPWLIVYLSQISFFLQIAYFTGSLSIKIFILYLYHPESLQGSQFGCWTKCSPSLMRSHETISVLSQTLDITLKRICSLFSGKLPLKYFDTEYLILITFLSNFYFEDKILRRHGSWYIWMK